MNQKNQLYVIEGGYNKLSAWKKGPPFVQALSPFNKSRTCNFRIAAGDAAKAAHNRRYQKLLDLWALVGGQVPPINNITMIKGISSILDQQALKTSHACFRGVKRPTGTDDTGWDTVVYISKPTTRLVFEPDMACPITSKTLPTDLVLMTCVKLDFPEGRPYGKVKNSSFTGVITNWELVEADYSKTNLPVDYNDRYRKRLW
ncbi:MAG: hypothetical protein ABJM86_03945 [Hyphomicrobiales bacterium]